MLDWGAHFTCIAPDTPGFGQSEPLALAEPDINDYADAVAEFVAALGINKIAAFGFHSGGIILVTALKRRADLFTALAIGGYAIWTPEEMAIFGEAYLPPFLPTNYGEHLTWLWNRVLEQSWFFPWFDVREQARLSVAHDDPMRADAVVREMLDAGDAYRLGYGAVLRAPRDIPPPDAITPPVLITAYNGDPLQTHLDRLGTMPAGWQAYPVDTPKAHQDASLKHLQNYAEDAELNLPQDAHQGFLQIITEDFDGLIHWQGPPDASRMMIHGPGREAELLADRDALRIDLPGHGLSSAWPGEAPTLWGPWKAVVDAAAAHFKIEYIDYEALPDGEQPDMIFPDLSPDRFGSYLTRAWSIVRAQHFFAPWYLASKDNVIPIDPAALEPVALAKEHRALIRATAARAFHIARLEGGF